MPVQLSIRPNRGGTAIVSISAKDEDGVFLSFADLINPKYQFMAYDGSIVNNLSFDNTTMNSLDVVLTGDDLEYLDRRESGKRFFSFKAQYNSSAGFGLYMTASCEFYIQDIVTGNTTP